MRSIMDLINSYNLLSFLLLILSLSLLRRQRKSKLHLPPGPWKLPIIGSFHHLWVSPLPHRALRELALRHGPIIHLKLGHVDTVVVSSAAAAREVMKTNDVAFANRPALNAA